MKLLQEVPYNETAMQWVFAARWPYRLLCPSRGDADPPPSSQPIPKITRNSQFKQCPTLIHPPPMRPSPRILKIQ